MTETRYYAAWGGGYAVRGRGPIEAALAALDKRVMDDARRSRLAAFEASNPEQRLEALGQRIRETAKRCGVTLTADLAPASTEEPNQ